MAANPPGQLCLVLAPEVCRASEGAQKILQVSLEATFETERVCCMGDSAFPTGDHGEAGGSVATQGGTRGGEGRWG